VNEKPNDVDALETIEQEEAYTTFNLGKLIDQVFKELKTIACDFPLLQKHLLSRLKVLKRKNRIC